MKIGLSLRDCIADIINGVVPESEVFLIVSRTHFQPENDAHWNAIWVSYAVYGIWGDFSTRETEVRQLVVRLHRSGKLHQPRMYPDFSHFGISKSQGSWMELMPSRDTIQNNPALKKAWDNFCMIANLSNTTIELTHNEEGTL